ncbi:MAG: hypothetical protein OEQ53_13970, partial [Saprospiraceae bacterium]|nr:hypothetical protein [Saprospiraceae bacterium]
MTCYDWAAIYFDPAIIDHNRSRDDFNFFNSIISTLSVTIVGGIFIASIEVFYFSKLLRRKPFGIALLIKTLFYSGNIFFFTSFAFLLLESLQLDKSLFHPDIMQDYLVYLGSPRSLSIWLFWGFSVMFALFILQVSEKLGQGVLANFLLGKYHRPTEVDRIFMFLDLKSSTSYAEKLGHLRYSELIQDCFYDLTEVVAKHRAQIYQYVGDEAVLIWKIQNGLKDL